MKLRDIEFGHVFNSSGARGFLGEGYKFHNLFKPFGLDYSGSTFVAKTTTLNPRRGNLPLNEDLSPLEFLPRSIKVNLVKGTVLNAVGLSGPGAYTLVPKWKQLLTYNKFEKMILSFSPLNNKREETNIFKCLLKEHFDSSLRNRIALQVNISCPNTDERFSSLSENIAILDTLADLNIPVLFKINALFNHADLIELGTHPALDGVVISNTIPWGKLPKLIDWNGLFGSNVSPLKSFGGGGLSGKPLLRIVQNFVSDLRWIGFNKAIVAGGGILSSKDSVDMLLAGADSIELGSVSILRPWRVADIIKTVNRYKGSNV